MKKYKRQPEKFEVFDLFSSLGPEWNLQFNDENSIRKFCEGMASSLRRYTTPIMLYGRHVESMFGYVAASLGECAVVKREDDGDVFLEIGDAKIPDYRLITKEKGTYLVEVKNFHGNDNLFMVNQEYFIQLQRYASVNGIELKIAVYWSKWNLWTLLSPTAFEHKDKKVLISMAEAIKQNEMSCILGDVWIGTLPRLSLKIYLEYLSQGDLPECEEMVYRITNVEVYCGNQVILDEEERGMAITLMMCGKWVEEPPITYTSKGRINAIEFIVTPDEYDKSQDFAIIGSMSSIVANHYKMQTAPQGTIEKIVLKDNISSLGFTISKDYVGKQLPLWRFHQSID